MLDIKELDFDYPETGRLSVILTKELTEERRLNEFLEIVLPVIAQSLGAGRISLVDYYEQTDHFDLLHFSGYPPESIQSLVGWLDDLELRRALKERHPFPLSEDGRLQCIPLYFSEILEAVLVLEDDHPIEMTPVRLEATMLISRILGLLMSSTRLAVNQKHLPHHNDLQRARQIQLSFLPKSFPFTDYWEIFGFNRSSALVGGDYFDYFSTRNNSLQCILADACGHGLAAALIMSNFRGLLQSEVSRHQQFQGLFDALNQSVHFDEDFIQYLTGVFLDLEGPDLTLRYFNAGHFEPLVISDQGQTRTLPGGGPPLGMFKQSRYGLRQARLDSGDLVVLFTDGIVEIEDSEGSSFGVEGISQIVEANRRQPLDSIARAVIGEAERFGGGKIEDDITLLLLRVR